MSKYQMKHANPSNVEKEKKPKHFKDVVSPIIAEDSASEMKLLRYNPEKHTRYQPDMYAGIDNDLAIENLENDLAAADLHEM